MPYSSVDELPKAVKDKLQSPKKRRQWMHVWNSDYAAHHDESRAFASAWSTVQKMQVGVTEMNDNLNFFMPICKIDKEQRTISGYASTNCLDSDGEVVAQEAIKAALPDYMTYGNIREMHRPWAVGVAQEANIDDRGLYVTAKVVDDNAWQKCVDQVYKGFSIGGKKQAKVGNTITKIALHEISIVDRPSNPECRFTVAKMQGGTLIEDDAILVKVSDGDDKEPDGDEDDAKPKTTKKAAKRAAKIAKRAAKESAPSSSPTAHDAGGGAEAALGKFESWHELDLELTSQGGSGRLAKLLLQGEDTEIQSLSKQRKSKGRNMAEDNAGGNVALTKALIQLLGGGQLQTTNRPNPTLGLLKSAEDSMKAMKSHRRQAEGCVEKLFNMHKGALTKTAGGTFDHAAAATLLKSLYVEIGSMKTLSKSARDNLTKAAERVSASGTVEDGVAGLYVPDPGGDLQLISPGEMDNLPASKATKPGNLQKGYVSPEAHEALLKAARLEAENALLKSMPAAPSGGRRPNGFDLSKFGGGSLESDNVLLKGINPSDLQSQDESTRETAVAKMVGNMIIGGRGQTVFDPNFHGTAGLGKPN